MAEKSMFKKVTKLALKSGAAAAKTVAGIAVLKAVSKLREVDYSKVKKTASAYAHKVSAKAHQKVRSELKLLGMVTKKDISILTKRIAQLEKKIKAKK